MTGIPIEHAYVNINGSHIMAQSGHGVVAVSKADGEIKEDDVARVIDAAQTVATPPNYEIIHVIPKVLRWIISTALRIDWDDRTPDGSSRADHPRSHVADQESDEVRVPNERGY